MLVVIGPGWLCPRLQDPNDHVRLEVAAALERNVRVIPVLVGGATMPEANSLPPDLAGLARRQPAEIHESRWKSAVGQLAVHLERLEAAKAAMNVGPAMSAEPEPAPAPPPAAEPPRGARSWWKRLLRRDTRTPRPRQAHRPNAGELAQKRALGLAEPAQAGRTGQVGDREDVVDCTVFAPTFAVPGETVFLQVFAHLVEQTDEARRLAREFDPEAERRAFKTLEAIVRRESILMFELQMERVAVADRVQSLVWQGRPASVQFEVGVPAGARPGAYVGAVTVSLDSVPIGHVKFKLAVVPPRRHGERSTEPVGDAAARYRNAFVSYSSEDRQAVLERVQMLRPLGIDFFQDLLDLDPGDRWERKLYLSIDQCDLFLLFWSRHAKASRWVRTETQYALKRKGDDDFAPPVIHPVILEGPPIPRPWPELAHMHFGDRLVYFMTGETRPEA
jgi:TIR domain